MSTLKLLTEDEQCELAMHEQCIENGMDTFVGVGRSLAIIRDGRLWRGGYANFEDYCKGRWGFGRVQASRMITGAEAAMRITEFVTQRVTKPPLGSKNADSVTQRVTKPPLGNITESVVVPNSERQVRPLRELPEHEQAEAWKEATDRSGGKQPTAKQVAEVVEERKASSTHKGSGSTRKPDELITDDVGNTITDERIAEAFAGRGPFVEVIKALGACRRDLKPLQSVAAAAHVDVQGAVSKLKALEYELKMTLPYALLPQGCNAAPHWQEVGFVSRAQYNTIPEDQR
jgi:hypothetical protein